MEVVAAAVVEAAVDAGVVTRTVGMVAGTTGGSDSLPTCQPDYVPARIWLS